MSRPREKRFSIDDAFEEEEPPTAAVGPHVPHVAHSMPFTRMYKCAEDATSKDSDSLIHESGGSAGSVGAASEPYCWRHPKVRENWRTVAAAVVLLLVGIGLLGMGVFGVAEPDSKIKGAVFLVAGLICFVPGAYHVVYVWLAARGRRGYDFYHLPLFT